MLRDFGAWCYRLSAKGITQQPKETSRLYLTGRTKTLNRHGVLSLPRLTLMVDAALCAGFNFNFSSGIDVNIYFESANIMQDWSPVSILLKLCIYLFLQML